ncbi:MAG: hypothetical protein LBJ07_00940 [Actinomycetes bacterium]|nr:hypothetical protein [Actinomycetes bacterium]
MRLAQEKVERERGIVLKTEVKFFEVLL